MTHPHTAAVRGGLTGPKNGASLTAGGGDRAAPGSFDPAEAARCRALWAEVINKALEDCKHATDTRGDGDYERRQAIAWFTTGGKDFRIVCDLAGVDPDAVRKRALAHIDGSAPIDFKHGGRKPGKAAEDIAARVVALHDAGTPGTLNHIRSVLGIAPLTAANILRAHGRTPRKGKPGEAYRQRHAEIVTAKKRGAKRGAEVSAAARREAIDRRIQPVLDLLAANPSMSVKEAAARCGVAYSTAKDRVRKARGK